MEKIKSNQYALRVNISDKAKKNIRKKKSFMERSGNKCTIEKTVNHILENLK